MLLWTGRHHSGAQLEIQAGGEPQELIVQVHPVNRVEGRSESLARIGHVGAVQGIQSHSVENLEGQHAIGSRPGKVEAEMLEHASPVRRDGEGRSNLAGETRLFQDLRSQQRFSPSLFHTSGRASKKPNVP